MKEEEKWKWKNGHRDRRLDYFKGIEYLHYNFVGLIGKKNQLFHS